MKRSEGESIRLKHTLERMRSHIDSIEVAMRLGGPIGADAAQGFAHTGSKWQCSSRNMTRSGWSRGEKEIQRRSRGQAPKWTYRPNNELQDALGRPPAGRAPTIR